MLIGTDEFDKAPVDKITDEVVVNVYSQTLMTKLMLEKLVERSKKGKRSLIVSMAS